MTTINQAVNVSVSDDAHFALLSLIHPAGNVYVVNNLEAVTSRGQVFEPYPFSFILPERSDDKNTELSLSIDNVDRRLIEHIRSLIEPPTVKLELVLSSDPDTVYQGFDFLRLSNVTYDAMTIKGSLLPDDFLYRRFGTTYDGIQFPSLFY